MFRDHALMGGTVTKTDVTSNFRVLIGTLQGKTAGLKQVVIFASSKMLKHRTPSTAFCKFSIFYR